jgi:hypothetical protein
MNRLNKIKNLFETSMLSKVAQITYKDESGTEHKDITYKYDETNDEFIVTKDERNQGRYMNTRAGPNTYMYQKLVEGGQGPGVEKAKARQQERINSGTFVNWEQALQQQVGQGQGQAIQGQVGQGANERLQNASNYRPPQSAQQVMEIIRQEFRSAGYPYMAGAAIANAAAESNFNASIRSQIRDKHDPSKLEDSVGLFQLNSSGAGRGMTTEQRQDPRLNTQRIIQEMKSRWNQQGRHTYPRGFKDSSGADRTGQRIDSLAAAVARRATTAELAGLFAYHVERPADQIGEMVVRSQLARSILGQEADRPISG